MNYSTGYMVNAETWIPFYDIADDFKKLPSYYKFCYFMSMFTIKRNVLSNFSILITMHKWNVFFYGNYYIRKQSLGN